MCWLFSDHFSTHRLPDAKSKNRGKKGHAERAAINTPIQGSAADVMMMAMLKLHRDERLKGKDNNAWMVLWFCNGCNIVAFIYLVSHPFANFDIELGWKVILQIHDEVICEGPEESHEEAMDIVVGTMERPFEMPLRVKLEVEAKCDVSWFLAK